jgi:hypothetical protein
MEATLGISLYRYLYLKLAKTLCLFYLFSTKSENKSAEQVLPGSRGGGEEVAQTMYTHVSICKNDLKK